MSSSTASTSGGEAPCQDCDWSQATKRAEAAPKKGKKRAAQAPEPPVAPTPPPAPASDASTDADSETFWEFAGSGKQPKKSKPWEEGEEGEAGEKGEAPPPKKPKKSAVPSVPLKPEHVAKMTSMSLGSRMFRGDNMGVDECEDQSLYAARTVDIGSEMAKRNLAPCPMCSMRFGRFIDRSKHRAWAELYDEYKASRVNMNPHQLAVFICALYERDIFRVQRAAGNPIPPWNPEQFLVHVIEHINDPQMTRLYIINELKMEISIAQRAILRQDGNGDSRPDTKLMQQLSELRKDLRRWIDFDPSKVSSTSEGLK